MEQKTIEELGKILDNAASSCMPIDQLSKQFDFTVEEAYAIQQASILQRIERGESLVGVKLGFTSKAKMEQMGVHDMIWGILCDQMSIRNTGQINLSEYIHPRAEPEICFRLGKTIKRHLKEEELFLYIDAIAPAIEIIDSRYENFKFSLEDVIADNCSSSGFVVGPWSDPGTPIQNLEINLFFDEELKQNGNSDAILGNPWQSVLEASRLVTAAGIELPKGAIILAGAATSAEYLIPDTKVRISVESLGDVELVVNS